MALYTDIAAEIFPQGQGEIPKGVRVHTAQARGIGLVRIEVHRDGLARRKGCYITLDLPDFAQIDEKDEAYVWAIAAQLRPLVPKQGCVLVAGIGNREVTADALGPGTADRIFVTRHLCDEQRRLPEQAGSLRPVAAVVPGVEGMTGLCARDMLCGLVQRIQPCAVIAVDSLCTSQARRMGRSVQISTAGLEPVNGACIDEEALGVPVIALGVPTVMQLEHMRRGQPLCVTPKEIDAVIRRGAALLALAINKALQPALSVGELNFLTS